MAISALSGVGSGMNPRCLLGSNPTTRPDVAAEDLLTPATHRAIDRGLAYLASRQNDDGSFGVGSYSRNVALCGLTGMTFLAGGNTPGRGRYGRHTGVSVNVD